MMFHTWNASREPRRRRVEPDGSGTRAGGVLRFVRLAAIDGGAELVQLVGTNVLLHLFEHGEYHDERGDALCRGR